MDKGRSLLPGFKQAEKPLHCPVALLPGGAAFAGRLPRRQAVSAVATPWDSGGHRVAFTPLPTRTAALLGIPPRLPREAG